MLCCFCVSALLPSSFSHGRIVSIFCLETGCRPATGFSLFLVVRSRGEPPVFFFCQPWVNQHQLSRLCSVFRVQTNHGEVFVPLIFRFMVLCMPFFSFHETVFSVAEINSHIVSVGKLYLHGNNCTYQLFYNKAYI